MMTRKAQPGSTTPGGTILSDFRNYGNVKVSPDHEHESPFDKLMALSIVEGRAHLFPAMERGLGNKELSKKRRAATSWRSRDRAKTISAEKVRVPFSAPSSIGRAYLLRGPSLIRTFPLGAGPQ